VEQVAQAAQDLSDNLELLERLGYLEQLVLLVQWETLDFQDLLDFQVRLVKLDIPDIRVRMELKVRPVLVVRQA
jgi:hypothetical protein